MIMIMTLSLLDHYENDNPVDDEYGKFDDYNMIKITWLKGTSRQSFLQNMFLGSMQASYTIHLVLVVIIFMIMC